MMTILYTGYLWGQDSFQNCACMDCIFSGPHHLSLWHPWGRPQHAGGFLGYDGSIKDQKWFKSPSKPFRWSEAHTPEDAIESAAKSDVEFLCKQRNVQVTDVNREALDDAFQDKTTAVLKSFAETNSKYTALENDLKELCNDFADWLPIERKVITEGAGKDNQFIFTYTGPPAFRNRKDQFTVRLLQLLQEPKRAQVEPSVSPNCKKQQSITKLLQQN